MRCSGLPRGRGFAGWPWCGRLLFLAPVTAGYRVSLRLAECVKPKMATTCFVFVIHPVVKLRSV